MPLSFVVRRWISGSPLRRFLHAPFNRSSFLPSCGSRSRARHQRHLWCGCLFAKHAQLRQPLSTHGFLADFRRAATCQMALKSATVLSVIFVSRPSLEVRLLLCMSPLAHACHMFWKLLPLILSWPKWSRSIKRAAWSSPTTSPYLLLAIFMKNLR